MCLMLSTVRRQIAGHLHPYQCMGKSRCSSVVIIYIEYVTVNAAFLTSKYSHSIGFVLKCRDLFLFPLPNMEIMLNFYLTSLDSVAVMLSISIFLQSPIQLGVPYMKPHQYACFQTQSLFIFHNSFTLFSFSSFLMTNEKTDQKPE